MASVTAQGTGGPGRSTPNVGVLLEHGRGILVGTERLAHGLEGGAPARGGDGES